MDDYRCFFNNDWRCPDKDISTGLAPCKIKQSKPVDDSVMAYTKSWDCPVAIKPNEDDG